MPGGRSSSDIPLLRNTGWFSLKETLGELNANEPDREKCIHIHSVFIDTELYVTGY